MKTKEFTITEDLLATREQRFLNFIIDLGFLYVIIASFETTVVIVADLTRNFELSSWVKSMTLVEKIPFAMLIAILYYGLSEIYFSRTVAKYLTKTIVVTKEGSRPKTQQIIIRTLTRFIPLEGLTFLSSNIRGLHDLFSNTYVVKKHEFNNKKGAILFP